MAFAPTPLRVTVELNYRTPSWRLRELLVVEKNPTHLVSEVVCVSKGETHGTLLLLRHNDIAQAIRVFES